MHARDQWKALLEEFSLYRQHQRLTNSGITLSRGTLTNLTTRAIELMKQAWFWPLMGDQDEISFTDSTGRGRVPIERVLEDWLGAPWSTMAL